MARLVIGVLAPTLTGSPFPMSHALKLIVDTSTALFGKTLK